MKNNLFYLVFFAVSLAIFRVIPHPPNFTPIIASAIMCPILTKDRIYGALIPILAMFISDIFIGFHSYQFIIYITLISISIFAFKTNSYLILAVSSILASTWFFLTTNFAVWVMWDYYPKTLEGLLSCYTLAIPFFQNTLLSTIFFCFVIFLSVNILDRTNKKIILFFDNLKNSTSF